MPGIKRTYKDSLFRHLFGTEERKANALELYNALAEKEYRDPGELELTTIGDVIFLGVKNDISFLVGDEMVLWEHQSTHSPNLPLRGLHYFSRLYTKHIETRVLDVYGEARLELPTPRFVVFYFGAAERPEREVLALSDSFTAGPGDLEVTATVLNCNEGRNRSIMGACEALRGYSRLVALDRGNRSELGMEAHEAVRAAVDQVIGEGLLVDYLTAHRAEVEDMLFTIQDEERALRVHREAVAREAREQGLQEGRAEGLREGRLEGLAAAVEGYMGSAGCGADEAMDALNVSAADREQLSAILGQ